MRVISNSAMSLDGKLATSARDHVALGSVEDRRRMSVLRARVDAVLIGGSTWRAWPIPMVEAPGEGPHTRDRRILNVVLTRTGEGPREGRFYEDERTLPVILGGPEARLEGFPEGVRVHRSEETATVAWALDLLEEVHGVETLLVEGGGDLIFQLVEARRLQEMRVTLCPWLVGGSQATTLVDGRGFLTPELPRLRLGEVERAEDELFLRYDVIA